MQAHWPKSVNNRNFLKVMVSSFMNAIQPSRDLKVGEKVSRDTYSCVFIFHLHFQLLSLEPEYTLKSERYHSSIGGGGGVATQKKPKKTSPKFEICGSVRFFRFFFGFFRVFSVFFGFFSVFFVVLFRFFSV